MIRLHTFGAVPRFARGYVRDLRVRWALEEAGMAYEEHLFAVPEAKLPAHLALQPFGQVPAVEFDDGPMFESGAIVLRIAEDCEALLPRESAGRARAIGWMFAALNTVEPPIQRQAELQRFHAGEAWAAGAAPVIAAGVERRLDALVGWLEGREYLETRFTAADLLMTTVLRILRGGEQIVARPVLAEYVARCEARPAFGRAMAAHLRPFEAL